MGKYTRGEFLGFGAALAGAFSLGRLGAGHLEPSVSAQPSTSGGEPDLIVVNPRVLTSDAALPRAEALALGSGRFVAVGAGAEVRNPPPAPPPRCHAQPATAVVRLLL